MPTYKISQQLIDRHSAGPSPSKTTRVVALHQTIRDVLGDNEYDTFLQGSYRNDTAIADINDVDIVARRKGTKSPLTSASWQSLFETIARRLQGSSRLSGPVVIRNRCVNLQTSGLNADIVPAAAMKDFRTDPIAIWSRKESKQRSNYPRTHYRNGVKKQAETNQTYKATVRLLKCWAKQYPDFKDLAPSFYLECAVHQGASNLFNSYLPMSLANVGAEICSWPTYSVIRSVAGDKDILTGEEWPPANFERFKKKLTRDLVFIRAAINATTAAEADGWWKTAFGEA